MSDDADKPVPPPAPAATPDPLAPGAERLGDRPGVASGLPETGADASRPEADAAADPIPGVASLGAASPGAAAPGAEPAPALRAADAARPVGRIPAPDAGVRPEREGTFGRQAAGTGAAGVASAAAGRRTAALPAKAAGTSPLGAIALFLVVLEGLALGALWAHPRVPPDMQLKLDRASAEADQARAQAEAADDAVAGLRAGLATEQAALGRARNGLDDLSARLRGPAPAASPSPAPSSPPPAAAPGATDADLAALRDGLAAAREESRNAVASVASLERADIAAVRSATTTAIDGFGTRLDGLSTRLDQQAAAGDRARVVADRAVRLARLQAAEVALSDGRPLGAIANAPPAVQTFADRSPPTLASLVLSFPDAARGALRASEPSTRGQNFFHRLWTRAEAAVTVREGNRVIVGDPAAGVIAAARERLEAGDLAGAVATLGELDGPAADAIDPWRSRAASLVDARAGLADMMAHS